MLSLMTFVKNHTHSRALLSMEETLRFAEERQIEILEKDPLLLHCRNCGAIWSVERLPDGTLPADWWQCPDKCNHFRCMGA